jgi:hypothetical protein
LNTQSSSDYTIAQFAENGISHAYVVTVAGGVMTVTMDGYEIFSGVVSLPPVAYLGFTGSTGGDTDQVTISSLNAAVNTP